MRAGGGEHIGQAANFLYAKWRISGVCQRAYFRYLRSGCALCSPGFWLRWRMPCVFFVCPSSPKRIEAPPDDSSAVCGTTALWRKAAEALRLPLFNAGRPLSLMPGGGCPRVPAPKRRRLLPRSPSRRPGRVLAVGIQGYDRRYRRPISRDRCLAGRRLIESGAVLKARSREGVL
jgi:hypothetical protein